MISGDSGFNRVQVKFYRETNNPLPRYSNHGDAGMDIRSNEDNSIAGYSWGVVSTGLYVVIPFGYEGQVRSRSGLAAKYGINVLNSPGTIDSGYRDELKVILKNNGRWAFEIKKGDRIAQLVIKPVISADIIDIKKEEHILESETTNRGGGLGSTGVK